MENLFRSKLESERTLLGSHVSLSYPGTTELMGMCGFDFVWIDTEHSALSLEAVESHIIAARAGGTASVVRIPWNDSVRLKPILEMGPDGIVIPMVNSFEEAQFAVRAFSYPPKGIRGFGPLRANQYGLTPLDEYLKESKRIVKILQIEHIDAVRDLDRILTIPEIDVLLIGPCDLSASIGKLCQWDDPEVSRILDDTAAKIRSSGKLLGVSLGPQNEDILRGWKARGVNMISMDSDASFIAKGVQETYSVLQGIFHTSNQ